MWEQSNRIKTCFQAGFKNSSVWGASRCERAAHSTVWGWQLKKQNSHHKQSQQVWGHVNITASSEAKRSCLVPGCFTDTDTEKPEIFQRLARKPRLLGWTVWRRPELFNTLVRQTKLQKWSLAEKGRDQSRLPLWSRALTFDLPFAGFPTRVSASLEPLGSAARCL